MTQKQRLVVIGNGMAGARLIEEVVARQGTERFEIVIFGDEPYGNYNRILLSNVLAGSHDPRDIFINSLSWYEEHEVKLYAGKHVHTIDCSNKVIYASDGIVMAYDKLVIATGSKPFLPPLKNMRDEDGAVKPGIFVFRSIDDCDAIVKYAGQSRRAAVIGGGLLGLEAARGLLNRELEVHLIHRPSHLMNVQLDEPASAILQTIIENMGVKLWLNKATIAVQGYEHTTGLIIEQFPMSFRQGETEKLDMLMTPGKVLYNLGPLTRLPRGEGRTFRIGDTAVAIFRTRKDEVFATQATCPHKNGPLADAIIGADQVICPLHAYKFQLTNGEPVGNTCTALKTYSVALSESGDILLKLNE